MAPDSNGFADDLKQPGLKSTEEEAMEDALMH